MKKIFVFIIIILVLTASFSEAKAAKSQHRHFVGIGSFIWNEILLSGNDPVPFALKAKKLGLKFIIVKAFDGGNWGVTKNGRPPYYPQFDAKLVKTFHSKGLKCYGYGTTRLKTDSDIEQQLKYAVTVLHMGADGIVLDDVFAYGEDEKQTEKIFSGIRKHMKKCSGCQGKVLAFSGFPHVGNENFPWEIPVKYADYFLPQLYWEQIRKGSPSEVFVYFEKKWSLLRQSQKKSRCRAIPVAQAYNEKDGKRIATPEELRKFFEIARSHGYHGAASFRWGTTSEKEWQAAKAGWKGGPVKSRKEKRRRPNGQRLFNFIRFLDRLGMIFEIFTLQSPPEAPSVVFEFSCRDTTQPLRGYCFSHNPS